MDPRECAERPAELGACSTAFRDNDVFATEAQPGRSTRRL